MEPVVRVGVTVTFLRMDRPPAEAAPGLPTGWQVVRAETPTVAFYRYLYNTVGAEYVWWLRRAASGRRTGDAAARSDGLDPRAVRQRRAGRLLRVGLALLAGRQPQLFRPDAARDRHRHRLRVSCARRWTRSGARVRAA